ncbi:heat-inducible transcriptional repressor HrcA [Priestia endophytica]|uniref:heat-inducible transcriptional repressor HrcA n=1 Tax=Priestia endophytica TaxID=135735 RepID=UPI000F54B3B2|nr:heat-inducible transcriptional repressor HrcA [Priestia endophytica]RPK15804.1 hypothetical protein FH5_01243 [Priestia endophytica]
MLTMRQLLILQAIVDDFVQSAQPIGSRTLSKKDTIQFSSATIRNEMADLEELGFIEKTHSSSGRVPSEKGYRYYVDHLLSPQLLTGSEMKVVKSLFVEQVFELEKVVQNAATILSEMTNLTSIALGPSAVSHKVRQLQILPLSEGMAVAIIVTDTGYVESKTITLPSAVRSSDLEKMVNILNERLVDVPISELHDKIYKEVATLLKSHLENYEETIEMLDDILTFPSSQKIYIGGKTNILTQPEFHDVSKMRSLLEVMEKGDPFYPLLHTDEAGIQVKIGREINMAQMDECSLITATYSIKAQQFGTIAILGPTRMPYGRIISLLQLITSDLSKALTHLYQKE